MPFVPDKQQAPQHVSSWQPDEVKPQPTSGSSNVDLSSQHPKDTQFDANEYLARPENDILRRTVEGIGAGGVGEISAPLSGLVSNLVSPIKRALAPAVERSAVLSQVKNEAGLGPYVSNKINQAEEAFNSSQIEPRMANQYKAASGHMLEVDPKPLTGIHPEIDSYISKYPVNAETGKISMPMEDALDLRAQLNSNTMFKQGGTYSNPADIMAKKSQALAAGNQIRSQISQVSPEVAQSSEELRQAYNLKNPIVKTAQNRPIAAVQAPYGSDYGSKLARFDEAAGSDLRGLGDNIKLAQSRLRQPGPIQSMIEKGPIKGLTSYAGNRGGQAYDAAATGLDKFIGKPATQIGLTGLEQYLAQKKNQDNN